MAASFRIRPGRRDDIQTIYDVHRGSVETLCADHYSTRQIELWLAGRGPDNYVAAVDAGRLHVAEQGGRIVGFVEYAPPEITKLFVVPDAASMGVGQALLEIGVDRARRDGSGPVVLEATLNAVSFYERFGFVTVGADTYSHGSEEAPPLEIVKMELPLPGGAPPPGSRKR